jgi:hypothetical protein
MVVPPENEEERIGPPYMRLKFSNAVTGWLIVTLLAAGHAAGQPAGDQPEVKHYGYSGQDKMLACIQKVFGKYAAAWPHTVLYGHAPTIRRLPPKIVSGHWESVVERVAFPPVTDLPCPNTREGIQNLFQSEVSKLLFVPLGEPQGIRVFETPKMGLYHPGKSFFRNTRHSRLS